MGRLLSLVLAAVLAAAAADAAEPPPFDLAGPDLRVSVTHTGVTLPISQAPNLSEGDELSIRADLPDDQSAHYLLVAAFLRGATNPPPKDWFFKAETWTRKGRDGLRIRVPAGAEQALVFLAPQAGGGFGTLGGAVRGRPGAFVRASQDLDEASLDRSRIDAFLAAVRVDGSVDPERLKTVSPLLARQPGAEAERRLLAARARAAGRLPDAGAGRAGAQRRPQRLDRRGADLRPRARPGVPA